MGEKREKKTLEKQQFNTKKAKDEERPT